MKTVLKNNLESARWRLVLDDEALFMEKLPRTPAKEMGSGLEELQCPRRKCSPPDHTPENTE